VTSVPVVPIPTYTAGPAPSVSTTGSVAGLSTTLATTPVTASVASATVSGVTEFSNAAKKLDAGFGALAVAGIAALML
jgi:hypothetical protein